MVTSGVCGIGAGWVTIDGGDDVGRWERVAIGSGYDVRWSLIGGGLDDVVYLIF